MIRQGDLLFVEVDKIPKDFLPKPGKKILAYGEVTGHTHRIAELGEKECAIYENSDGTMYVDARGKELRIPHEEHDTVVLSALYRVDRQREYDPDEALREKLVAD